MTNDQLSPTLNGSLAILNRIIVLETAVTQLQARVAEVEYLISEELIAQTPPTQARQVVAELGANWQIVRELLSNSLPAISPEDLAAADQTIRDRLCPSVSAR